MKTKFKFSLAISICFLAVFGFGMTDVLATPVLHEAHESFYSGDPEYGIEYSARYDLQGDVVYEDGSGYTDYAIWAAGVCDRDNDWLSTRIISYIYVSAYYIRQRDIFPLQTIYYWDPIPSGLITWTGDIDLHTDYYRWDWTVDSQEKYSDLLSMYKERGSKTCSSKNSISGDYRYLGYVNVYKIGQFGSVAGYTYYDALIKLHVDNALAEDWDEGHYEWGGYFYWVTRILKFQIKIITKFQYEWFGWKTACSTQTFIFGDGTPSTDLSNIPLVVGTIEGAT